MWSREESRERGGEHEESGGSTWAKDREVEQRKRYFERGSNYGVREKPDTRKVPRNHKEDPS